MNAPLPPQAPARSAWTPRRRRLVLLIGAGVLAAVAATLLLNAFRSNLVFFLTPTELAGGAAQGRDALRVGGLVQVDSIRREPGSLRVNFVLTDHAHSVPVVYDGVLPDLFAAGKGAIAQGRLDASGRLVASEVLAKHDENYMPPEVHDALKQGAAQAAAASAAAAATLSAASSPEVKP